jgi:hypothetical protein
MITGARPRFTSKKQVTRQLDTATLTMAPAGRRSHTCQPPAGLKEVLNLCVVIVLAASTGGCSNGDGEKLASQGISPAPDQRVIPEDGTFRLDGDDLFYFDIAWRDIYPALTEEQRNLRNYDVEVVRKGDEVSCTFMGRYISDGKSYWMGSVTPWAFSIRIDMTREGKVVQRVVFQ